MQTIIVKNVFLPQPLLEWQYFARYLCAMGDYILKHVLHFYLFLTTGYGLPIIYLQRDNVNRVIVYWKTVFLTALFVMVHQKDLYV